jgi:protoporphyrinogen oxidase
MSNFAVLGAGPMGLAAAHSLVEAGHKVTLFEADDRLGGMSASFDFDGLSIERYYHFLCKSDYPLFAYAERLGLSDKIKWQATTMGYYFSEKVHPWGTPLALLAFPHLDLITKLRYGLHVYRTSRITDWSILEDVNAKDWIERWVGKKGYDVLWKGLFDLKFFEYSEELSAAWIGTRIKRVGTSRRNPWTEELGYIEGGSEVLMQAIGKAISNQGGTIRLNQPVSEVVVLGGRVAGVRTAEGFLPFDGVLSTVPLPYLPRLIPQLPLREKEQILAIKNIGVVCVILKLSQPLTPHFWLNVRDSNIAIPGLIEFSNLRSFGAGNHIVYLPYYMPQTHPKFRAPEDWFYLEACKYLGAIEPRFKTDWIKAAHFHRYQYAQVVCPPGFAQTLPNMESEINGLFYADTSYYYPEDRSMSESLRLGLKLGSLSASWAEELNGQQRHQREASG